VCRVHIEADRSLKIERVRLSDAGVYMCHAENAVTFVEASARLTIHCTLHCSFFLSIRSTLAVKYVLVVRPERVCTVLIVRFLFCFKY